MIESIRDHIKSMGIRPEDEHFDVAELIIEECLSVVKNSKDAEKAIKEHFGM